MCISFGILIKVRELLRAIGEKGIFKRGKTEYGDIKGKGDNGTGSIKWGKGGRAG